MPLVYQQNINLTTKLGVWHIQEEEEFFLKTVCIQTEIHHPHKRLQHLAGRYILQDLFPKFPVQEIKVGETRKPFLQDDPFHFSVSHCGDYAAAIVSKECRVGVDIEIPREKISAIRHKFLESKELGLLESLALDPVLSLTLFWSIKEAIYKWYGAGKVDFRAHMQIQEIFFENNHYTVKCSFTKESSITLVVQGIFINGNSLAWITT